MATLIKFLSDHETYLKNNTINWLSIGCASYIHERKVIEEKNDHQFPPFLRKLQKKYPKIVINFILIDPELEDVPHFIDEKKWSKLKNNIFNNGNLTVYCFKEKINMNDPNILSHLISIKEYVTKIRSLLLIHDFTGGGSDELADILNNNYVLYNISLGRYNTCDIDLSLPICHPVIENGRIFNPLLIENLYNYRNCSDNFKCTYVNWAIAKKIDAWMKVYTIYRQLIVNNSQNIDSNTILYAYDNIFIKLDELLDNFNLPNMRKVIYIQQLKKTLNESANLYQWPISILTALKNFVKNVYNVSQNIS